MDGTANPWLRADIGIRSDRIAAIGRLTNAQGRTTIDAADRLVTPGFIDVHSHAAEGLLRQQLRQGQPLLAQGVTTIVANPDGGGNVDLAVQRARLKHIMRQPYTMTSSDGGLVLAAEGKPHPRDYGAYARKLAVYVRERHTISLESAIRSMTTLPAAVFGIRDRGILREGAFADIAVFDPAKIRDRATYTEPHQLAEGISYVLVNGIVVVDDGKFTSALPGRVLKK